jgi:hypothetical protein
MQVRVPAAQVRFNTSFELGDLGDVLTVRVTGIDPSNRHLYPTLGVNVRPGTGDDAVYGSAEADEGVSSEDSPDGADTIRGGGGGGLDRISYEARSAPITADLDGVPDDGEALERDDIGPGVSVIGGSGNDVITGGDHFFERLEGGPGDDRLYGGPGQDELIGGTGADVTEGGPDFDSVWYLGLEGVTVTLDGVANDGEPGEGDNVPPDMEAVHGGLGDDRLTGNSGANRLYGHLGDDRLEAGGGPDMLVGAIGSDVLQAGDGDDLVMAHEDFGVPRNTYFDTISCGSGEDYVMSMDSEDSLEPGCEVYQAPGIGQVGTITGCPPWVPGGNRCTVRLPVNAGIAPVPVACPPSGPARCAGSVTLRLRKTRSPLSARTSRGGAPLGRRRFVLRKGRLISLRVRLNRRARRLMARRRELPVHAVVRYRTRRGAGKTVRRRAILVDTSPRPPRQPPA